MLKLDSKDRKIVNAAIATIVVVAFALYFVSHYSESTCDTLGLRYVGEVTPPESG